MTDARGHVELLHGTWYLRRWSQQLDVTTGAVRRRQQRVRLGKKTEIRTRARARAAADRYLAKLTPATLQPGPRVTFVKFSEKFIADHVSMYKPSSRRRYRGAIKLLQQALGNATLQSIDTPRLQSALTQLSAGRSPATVKSLRGIVLQILRRARLDGYAAHSIVTRDVKLPKQTAPASEPRHWTRIQLEQLLEASEGQWRALWAVMAYAGLRCGEAFGLTWSDVNLDARTLTIRRTATRDGLTAPKTTSSAATVPLLPRLIEILQAHRQTWRENARGLLFATSTGNPLSADTVRRRQWARLLKAQGLPHAGLHSLRHSLPRMLGSMGITIDVVSRFMRHTSIAMTQRYWHVQAVDVRQALDAALDRQSAQASAGLAQS